MSSATFSLRTILLVVIALIAGFLLAHFIQLPQTIFTPHEHSLSAKQQDIDEHDHSHEQNNQSHIDNDDTIQLTDRQQAAAGISVISISQGGGQTTRITGRVEAALHAKATIAATLSGRVERIEITPGKRVELDQAVAHMISNDAAALFAQHSAAKADAEAANMAYQRDNSLFDKGVIARQELEASRARALAADATARATQAQLTSAGSPDVQGRITLFSPLSGIVDMVSVTQGRFINAGDSVAELSDPTNTELVFNAPSTLAARITAQSRLQVQINGKQFEAEVVGIITNTQDRAGVSIIRAQLHSADLPMAGTPVSATLITEQANNVFSVPAEAVQVLAGRPVVFIQTDEGFKASPVMTGFRSADRIEILAGLNGDERIAARNAFLLKAELSKGEADHAH